MINQRLLISIVDETFASGREFLDSLERQHPDRVILDLPLPVLSGSDVQQQLAQQSPTPPIITIIGRDDPGVGDRLRTAGAAACLDNPLEERGLLEAVVATTGAGIAMEEPGIKPTNDALNCVDKPIEDENESEPK